MSNARIKHETRERLPETGMPSIFSKIIYEGLAHRIPAELLRELPMPDDFNHWLVLLNREPDVPQMEERYVLELCDQSGQWRRVSWQEFREEGDAFKTFLKKAGIQAGNP